MEAIQHCGNEVNEEKGAPNGVDIGVWVEKNEKMNDKSRGESKIIEIRIVTNKH